ncbi:hypothetical protein GCM10028805_36460 [Spirosoma harenae]
MSEQPTEDTTPKPDNLKTSLDVSVTMAFITASEYAGEAHDMWPKFIRIFAPLIGLIVSRVVVYWIKNYEDNKDESRISGYIESLQRQIETPRLSPTRKQALLDEQKLHQEDLGKLRRRRTKRKVLN